MCVTSSPGSRQGLLHVYAKGSVAWVARADAPPVAVAVATVGELPGVLCTLSSDGVAVAGYLGTDASDMDGLTAVHVRTGDVWWPMVGFAKLAHSGS